MDSRNVLMAVLVLAAPGFFFNCQPSEPFLTRYLLDDKNLTETQLDERVWPADVYASLAFALPVAFLAETIGYLWTLFLGMLLREATRVILIWGTGVGAMVAMQITYAGGHAANIAYFALPYVMLEPGDSTVAAATAAQHAAYHLGNVAGSGLAQGLVSSGAVTDLRVLFYLSWAATSAGLVLLLCVPLLLGSARRRSAYRTLFGEVRAHGLGPALRHLWRLALLRHVAAACAGLILLGCCWEILGNYFQENLREFGMNKSLYGYVE
jgi:hypothetical protein